MLKRSVWVLVLLVAVATAAVAANRFRVGGGTYTVVGAGGAMTFANRCLQPGVLLCVEMSSDDDMRNGGIGTTEIRDTFGGGTLVTYDAGEDAMKITVPMALTDQALAWTKSLPFANQFDNFSEFWIQFDVKWDAGMLTASFNGGGPKFMTVDAGNLSAGQNQGSCTNVMSGQLQMGMGWNVLLDSIGRVPTMAHSCGSYVTPSTPSGSYWGLYQYLPGNLIYVQNKANCEYHNSAPCFQNIADEWHTYTFRVKVGTWYANDLNFRGDSQVDLWVSRSGVPLKYLISHKTFDIENDAPGTVKFGKIWLLPYDTGRTGSSVDGHVWYRRVIWSGQALKDPETGLPIVPDAPVIPTDPPPSTLTAIYLGITGEDLVGQLNQTTPNGNPDHHMSVAGLRGSPTQVHITRTAGIWHRPFSGNWIIAQTQVGATADYWFEPSVNAFGPYHVKVTYADLTTDEADAVEQVPSPILTVATVGTGTVVSTTPVDVISCGGDCTETSSAGTAFVLAATPGTNYVFSGWSGGGCSGTSTCSLTLQANTTVTATFTLQGGTLPAIANNGWLQVTPVTNGHYVIDGPITSPLTDAVVRVPALQQAYPSARSYSGIWYGAGRLFYFGGAHTGYAGNDVEVYEVATNTWTQSWIPEACPNAVTSPCRNLYNGTSSAYRTPLDRPYSEHTYQQGLWNPVLSRFEIFTRGVGPWRFDHTNNTIAYISSTVNGQGVYYPWGGDVAKEHAFWSPALSDRLALITSGGTGVGIWRQTFGGTTPPQWGRLATTLPTGIGGGNTPYSVYVPTQGRHFFQGIGNSGGSQGPGGQRWWYWFNATTLVWTEITMPSGANVADAFTYDSKNDKLLLLQDSTNPIKLWSCTTANTPVCTQETLTASPPYQTGKAIDVRANLPSFVYDDVNNVAWYHPVFFSGREGSTQLWAYRYAN